MLRSVPVVAFLCLISGFSASGTVSTHPEVIAGTMNFARGTGAVDLVGSWAFWPGQFINPSINKGDFVRFEQFPASWSSYEPERFPGRGYGSYAVQITGLDPSVRYAFWFPGYSCASRYFVNGKELHSVGTPSERRSDETPRWDTEVVPFPATGLTEVTLVLHISNHNDIFPACPTAIQVGSYDALLEGHAHKRLLMIIPFAAILAMGAYFIALYVFQHEENSCLWLGVLCINFALRILSYDEFMLQDIFPFFPTALMFRLGYLTFAIALAGFAGFFRAQYPDQSNRKIIHTIIGVALVYSLCDLFTPIDFFTSLLVPFQVFSLLSGLYVNSILVRAVIHREQGSILLHAGFFVFFLIIVHDMMIANRMIDGVFLSHYGILCIIAAMALIVVSRFTGAFNRVEAATDELAKINASLFRFVPNEFLNFLGKRSITEVSLGDNVLKDMCVMFVHLGMDIELTSADSRRNMLEMFNDTLRAVNPVIQKHHGFVDKYLADGLMVLFPDDPQSAVRCAVEIRGIMDAYNAERKGRELPCISFAAGVHRGPLMLGTIGESERMDSTVISDVVNTASRLLRFALSKGATIIVSEMLAGSPGFAESCGVSLLPHGEVMLKGRQQPIFVYEVRNP